MADNDKLDINFKDLARSASQYVFSSTFPSLERMLKTVQTTGEENKQEVEDLSSTISSVNIRLNDINVGLRKLNDAMSKSLGILGKILKAQDSSSGADSNNTLPGGGLNNISKAAGATLGAGAMMSVIENQHSAPGPETSAQGGDQGAKPSTPIAGGSTSSLNTPNATKAASPTGSAPSTPAPQPEKKDASAAGGGKTLLIKASTIIFEAGQIMFTSGSIAGSSSGGTVPTSVSSSGGSNSGGTGPTSVSSSGGSRSSGPSASLGASPANAPMNMPAEENQQQPQGGASGAPGSFESAVAGQSGGMTTLKTKRGKSYQVASQDAKKFHGFVDELERSGYQINQIGGYRQSAMWHGKGMAIDINPDQNPMLENKNGRIINRITGQEASELKNPRYPFGYGKDNFGSIDVSNMAKKHGLGWGGNWKSSTDTMHFSSGPNEMTEPTPQAIAARGGGGGEQQQTAAASPAPAATPVSKPEVASASSSGGPSAPLGASPADKKPPAASMQVASIPTKGAELNSESTSSEVGSITPPARASMNSIGAGGGQQKESDVPPNPKITNANKAGNVEPDDAAQRYESLFGMKPKVPTGSGARV
jgi:hypothetical protein